MHTRSPATKPRRGEAGNVAVLAAFAIPAILSVAGIAIDLQNTVRQKSKVQFALDSAVLAGALSRQAGASEEAIIADVQAYTASLISEQGGGLTCTPVTVTFDASNKDINGLTHCRQPTYLTHLIGKEELRFRVAATSTYGVGKVDVAFIFDVSGSMNSFNRLALLKTAAAAGFDELLPDDGRDDGNVRIALASYNHSLNAGPYINAVTNSVSLSADTSNSNAQTRYNTHNGVRMFDAATGRRFFYYQRGTCTSGGNCRRSSTYTWSAQRRFFEDTGLSTSCIYERIGGQASTDAAPGSNRWLGAGNPRWNFSASSTSKYDGWKAVDPGNSTRYGTGAYQGRHGTCRPSGPVPLTDDKTVLKAHVDSLTADGGTAGHLGFAWAWYLVSPNWAGIWPEASRPWNYDEPQSSKAIVMMTDGDFNINHPTTSATSFQQSMALCDAMKAAPSRVQVYTVGFQVPSNVQRTGDGRTILEYCASTPGHVFNASNGDELTAAYRSIARSISDLRIRK